MLEIHFKRGEFQPYDESFCFLPPGLLGQKEQYSVERRPKKSLARGSCAPRSSSPIPLHSSQLSTEGLGEHPALHRPSCNPSTYTQVLMSEPIFAAIFAPGTNYNDGPNVWGHVVEIPRLYIYFILHQWRYNRKSLPPRYVFCKIQKMKCYLLPIIWSQSGC